MHLSLPSYSTRCAFGDFDGARLIRDAGFDAVDMSYYYLPENSEALSDGYLDYSKRLKEHLDSIGLICNQAHAPFPLSYGVPFSEDDPTYRSILRSVRAAGILGAKNIVVHSINVPYEAPESTWDYNLAFYRSLIPTAAEYGVKLAVETLFSRDKKRHKKL